MSSVALRGNLEDFGIADVFQLIGQQRKTGVLEFSGKRDAAQLLFDRGAVVSAAPVGSRPHEELGDMLVRCGLLTRERALELGRECEASAQSPSRIAVDRGWLDGAQVQEIEDLLTRETIFDLLRWSSGSFDFHAQEIEHDRDPDTLLGAEQILMDSLRMVDEWQSFAETIPSEDLVFRRVGDFETFRAQAGPDVSRRLDAAERVFFLVDGRLAVRRIIDLSLLGTFDATRSLSDLRRARMIEPVDSAGLRRLQDLGRPSLLGEHPVRVWLSALVPLLLLLAVAIFLQRTITTPTDGAFPIARAPLGEVSAGYADRRVRNALAAFRFARGRWPENLREIESAELLESSSLASSSGRPYYYAQRDGAVVLLAPELSGD